MKLKMNGYARVLVDARTGTDIPLQGKVGRIVAVMNMRSDTGMTYKKVFVGFWRPNWVSSLVSNARDGND